MQATCTDVDTVRLRCQMDRLTPRASARDVNVPFRVELAAGPGVRHQPPPRTVGPDAEDPPVPSVVAFAELALEGDVVAGRGVGRLPVCGHVVRDLSSAATVGPHREDLL